MKNRTGEHEKCFLHKTERETLKKDEDREREKDRGVMRRRRRGQTKTDELFAAGFVILANLISIICFLHI